ncbi:unnamed protein product [Plasmodium vivax]|uniref:(malaria parasite P. vivax) hypothetical protein n=1 Tax=Plasmodium vivax TaxID=5855 RepID=A0A8S4H783_PLAVI|nr:unnamed protein product [Plasmodium vivax]
MPTEKFFADLSKLSKSFSGELNSENFYNRLDSFKNYSEYNKECESLTKLRHGSSLKRICAKLLNYLKTNTKSNKEDVKYDVCILLNYWLFSNLNIFLYSLDSTNIYLMFAKIEQIWNDFIEAKLKKRENETCKPLFNLIIHNDWRKRKDLYEYYVNYDQISKTIVNYPHRCKDFYEYIENKIPLFDYFKQNCPSTDTNLCPDFYLKCNEYNPKNVLHKFSCHKEIEKAKADVKSLSTEQEVSSAVVELDPSLPKSGKYLSETSYSMPNSTNPVIKFGDILLGAIVTSMTSGAIYKFTPFGKRLQNRFGSNRNTVHNINGEVSGLFDYASEPFNPYLDGAGEHQIGYHPA